MSILRDLVLIVSIFYAIISGSLYGALYITEPEKRGQNIKKAIMMSITEKEISVICKKLDLILI